MENQVNAKIVKCNVNQQIIAQTCNVYGPQESLSEPFHLNVPNLTEIFEGRDDEMTEIDKLIFNDERKHKMVVVSGFSGIGKSEFIKQYVSTYENKYNVLWIDAEREENIKDSFAKIFKIKKDDCNDVLVKSRCQSLELETFVIFDNASNRKEISKYEVKKNSIRYIVSSTTQFWGPHVPVMILNILKKEAALQIFKSEINFDEKDVKTYEKITKSLGYVPLALRIAASYLQQEINYLGTKFNLQSYIEQLEKPDNYGIKERFPEYSNENYNKSFFQALKITIDKIKRNGSLHAWNILNISAYLFSNRILFSDLLNIPHFKAQIIDNTDLEINLRRACGYLRNYSLISNNSDESFQIHNLIQKSLICDQNSTIDKENIYFYYNLEMLLDVSDTARSHRNFILNPFLDMSFTFNYFLSVYFNQIINCGNLFINLIHANCQIYIEEIFKRMDKNIIKEIIDKYHLLIVAVQSKHYRMVELMINKGGDINITYENKTALIWAAHTVDIKIMDLLINNNCDVNFVPKYNNNVLVYLLDTLDAVRNKDKTTEALEMLRRLVKLGVDVNARGWYNKSLLHVAAESLNVDVMSCLIKEYGLDVEALDIEEQTPIFYIRWSMDSDCARRLTAAKFLVDAKANVDHKDKFNNTAAEAARIGGILYLTEYLSNTNLDITNIKEEPHADELQRACIDGNMTTVQRIFKDLGSQAAQLAENCHAPHLAVNNEQYEVLDFLLENGVSVDSRGDANKTILHTAAYSVNFKAIKKLVANGADLSAVNVDGWSVLFFLLNGAGIYYHYEEKACDILKWLLEQGADPTHIDNDNTTAVHMTAAWNTPLLMKCLVQEFGLDINAIDSEGIPLHSIILGKFLAISEDRWWETIQCLLDLGASVDAMDCEGRTSIDLAKMENLTELENLLMAHQQKHIKVGNSEREAIENLNEHSQNEANETSINKQENEENLELKGLLNADGSTPKQDNKVWGCGWLCLRACYPSRTPDNQ